jgi:hypothetical protein
MLPEENENHFESPHNTNARSKNRNKPQYGPLIAIAIAGLLSAASLFFMFTIPCLIVSSILWICVFRNENKFVQCGEKAKVSYMWAGFASLGLLALAICVFGGICSTVTWSSLLFESQLQLPYMMMLLIPGTILGAVGAVLAFVFIAKRINDDELNDIKPINNSLRAIAKFFRW